MGGHLYPPKHSTLEEQLAGWCQLHTMAMEMGLDVSWIAYKLDRGKQRKQTAKCFRLFNGSWGCYKYVMYIVLTFCSSNVQIYAPIDFLIHDAGDYKHLYTIASSFVGVWHSWILSKTQVVFFNTTQQAESLFRISGSHWAVGQLWFISS